MSQHKSLQGVSGLVIKRNVLKRFERVDLLKKPWSVEGCTATASRASCKTAGTSEPIPLCTQAGSPPLPAFFSPMHDLFKGLFDWYNQSLATGGYPLIVLLMAIESSGSSRCQTN